MYESPQKYQVGRTRIYFQAGVQELLEQKRNRLLLAYHVLLQRMSRGWLARIWYTHTRECAIVIQANTRSYLTAMHFHSKREGRYMYVILSVCEYVGG